MKFRIISVTRKVHDRHLTRSERLTAKGIALASEEWSQMVIDCQGDAVEVPIHKVEIEANTDMGAMRLYHEKHQGTEILFCDALDEVPA